MSCEEVHGKRYRVQGDSGRDGCVHDTSLPQAKYIADTCWDTPDWCPFPVANQVTR